MIQLIFLILRKLISLIKYLMKYFRFYEVLNQNPFFPQKRDGITLKQKTQQQISGFKFLLEA